jgi:hypothetical protein
VGKEKKTKQASALRPPALFSPFMFPASFLLFVGLFVGRYTFRRWGSLWWLCGFDFGNLRIDANFDQVEVTLSLIIRIDLRFAYTYISIASSVVNCCLEAEVELDWCHPL